MNREAVATFGEVSPLAGGSLAELETHLELARRIGLVATQQTERCYGLAEEVDRMLSSLLRKLKETR